MGVFRVANRGSARMLPQHSGYGERLVLAVLKTTDLRPEAKVHDEIAVFYSFVAPREKMGRSQLLERHDDNNIYL
jgi:hypothetical protein